MNGLALLDLARALAVVLHDGQSRKGTGEPYFEHVRRVAEAQQGWRRKTIAFLHDLLEDTALTATDLLVLGFPADIVADVVALSRVDGENYFDFIGRAKAAGVDATSVKLADIRDNLRDLDNLPGDRSSMRGRYISAEAALLEYSEPS